MFWCTSGRCLGSGASSLGCADDLLRAVDTHCSGKQTCEKKVEANFENYAAYSTCPDNFRKYLEAEYHCQKGKTFLEKIMVIDTLLLLK